MRPKVLIIDDNKGDMQLIKDIFEEGGVDYQILWAQDGQEGLEIAQKESPEIIFLDTFMPKLNGFEVCERLKKDGQNKPYIILMSGAMEDFSKLESKNLLADGFCGKKPTQILREMLQYLAHKSKELQAVPKIRVLLVEDNKGDQALLKEALQESGLNFELSIIEQADKIVPFVEGLNPHLIFMDVIMSGLTGGDAAKLLKQNARTKNIPIIFLTGILGSRDEESSSKGINVDGQNYPSLGKPVDSIHLRELVKKHIK